MSFFDKAKQAATEMAAKADGALSQAGLGGSPGGAAGSTGTGNREAERLLRDLGIFSYRHANGQPSQEGYERSINALRQLEAAGQLGMLTSSDQAPPPLAPPPPPGAAAAMAAAPSASPPPPPGSTPPPPSMVAPTQTPPPPAPAPATDSGGGQVPPPPPPSWASTP